jgi:hypothetical protein
MDWIVRGILALWGIFFGWIGISGLIDPQTYVDTFGISGDAAAMNTIRADFSAFFLMSGGAACWTALRPEHSKLLLVPIAAFGLALAGRLLGLMLGDPFAASVRQSVIVEAVSVVLLVGVMLWLGRKHEQKIKISLN